MITDKLILLALLVLAWDYPFDRTNIVFEVWRSETSNMAGACLETTTPRHRRAFSECGLGTRAQVS